MKIKILDSILLDKKIKRLSWEIFENNLNEKYLDITEVDVKEMTEIINNLKDILGELENKVDLIKNKVD